MHPVQNVVQYTGGKEERELIRHHEFVFCHKTKSKQVSILNDGIDAIAKSLASQELCFILDLRLTAQYISYKCLQDLLACRIQRIRLQLRWLIDGMSKT